MGYSINGKCFAVIVIVVATILIFTNIVMSAEYSADLKYDDSYGGNPKTGKIYVKGQMERREFSGYKDLMIINMKKKLMWILTPGTRSYIEQQKNTNDINLFSLLKGMPGFKKVGTGKIAGYMCEKYIYNDTKTGSSGTAYFSHHLNQVLKWNYLTTIRVGTKMKYQNMSYILSNIKEYPQDDSLFKIPQGFKKSYPRNR